MRKGEKEGGKGRGKKGEELTRRGGTKDEKTVERELKEFGEINGIRGSIRGDGGRGG